MSQRMQDSDHCLFDTLSLYICKTHVCYYFSTLILFLSALLVDSLSLTSTRDGSSIDYKLQEQHQPINLTSLILKRSCAICAMVMIVFVGVMTREYLMVPMQNIKTINETLSTNFTISWGNASLSSLDI